jgi:two-component system response regulator AtoC
MLQYIFSGTPGVRMTKPRVLFVDDEPLILECIKEYFREYEIATESSAVAALKLLERESYEVLVVDQKMPGLTGSELLAEARKRDSYRYGILLSAYVDKALLKSMVNDNLVRRVLEKPLKLDDLKRAVDEALFSCMRELDREREIGDMRSLLGSTSFASRIIGAEGGLEEAYRLAVTYSASDENVLITGETGTGKEVVARLVHSLSRRKTGPFVKVNCAAIPDSLIESEFFGHEKGAFTGAIAAREGRIEAARGGTLFLDEIGELKPELQAKLLHVLQERRFERIGSNESIVADFRLICATNRPIEESLREKAIREDLYYRISTLTVELPPLRSRKGDIEEFCHVFLSRHAAESGRGTIGMAAETLSILSEYPWPGNVRELENALKRAVILLDPRKSVIAPDSFAFLKANSKAPPSGEPMKALALDILADRLRFEDIETEVAAEVLAECGSVMEAARRSGIPKDRFYRLVKAPPRQRDS